MVLLHWSAAAHGRHFGGLRAPPRFVAPSSDLMPMTLRDRSRSTLKWRTPRGCKSTRGGHQSCALSRAANATQSSTSSALASIAATGGMTGKFNLRADITAEFIHAI